MISFVQRLISQDHGYFPPFFEVLHFYKTSLLCEIMHSTFADTRHLRSLRARFPDLYDFIHDPGHHQQPCVYIRLSPWHTPYYVGATDQDVLRREHSRSRKFLQLLRGRHAFFEPALHYWKRSNTYWLFCAVPVEIKLPVSSVWVQESKWQYLLRPHLNVPWVHRILRKVGFREHLVDFRRHSLSPPTSISLHKRFRRRLHPDLQRQLRPDILDDIQAHYSILYQLGSNTGASFQVMRDLLSAAFPPTQLYYLLRLAVFVNEPFRSKAQKLLAQVLRKRRLQPPTTLTQLLLPPLHVRNWKALLGTWLQSWIASHRDLFPSLFIPKIQVVETRSATLGDKIYNYRTWQRRWTPETSFPCRCLDIDDHHIHHAHGHAVMVDEFSRINADIDAEIMAASMKDQYFGDVDLLHQRFTTQLSWESVYRSLMPHRRSIIEDEQRVKSISEFPFAQPPHGVPGRWTDQVVRDISDYFQISPRSLPQQLIVQLGICEEKWPYISRTTRTFHHFSADKKNSQKNLFGIIFSFEPRRLLPDKHRTQSQSTFFWSHNTNMQAAMQILRDEELIRPSKWQEHPSPNRECSNWNEVWLPPMGFYCRGSLQSQEAAIQSAAQFGGIRTDRPVCIGGSARLRQQHCTIPRAECTQT